MAAAHSTVASISTQETTSDPSTETSLPTLTSVFLHAQVAVGYAGGELASAFSTAEDVLCQTATRFESLSKHALSVADCTLTLITAAEKVEADPSSPSAAAKIESLKTKLHQANQAATAELGRMLEHVRQLVACCQAFPSEPDEGL